MAGTTATIGQVAGWIGGQVRGDAELCIRGIATIGRVQPGELTFVAGEKAWEQFRSSPAAAAIVSGVTPEAEGDGRPVIVVEDAEAAFAAVMSRVVPRPARSCEGISPHALISATAVIGADVTIQPGAFVGDRVTIGSRSRILSGARIMEGAVIGADTTVFPNAVIYDHCVIGDRVLIHAGAVIGAFGFGYRQREGQHRLGPQLGRVVIEDDVEIGANSTIDRGTFDDTVIGRGSKLDDQVMVGHNCRIGPHNLLCSQVGIAGSTVTGSYVVMAGQVGIGDHLEIGDGVTLCAKSGVMHSIPAGETHVGAPSMPVREQFQIWALTNKLPELRRQVRDLAAAVKAMQAGPTDAPARAA